MDINYPVLVDGGGKCTAHDTRGAQKSDGLGREKGKNEEVRSAGLAVKI